MALPKRRRDQKQSKSTDGQPDWHAFYDIENPEEVDAYVKEHPSLVPILAEAPGEIGAVFGDTGAPKLRLQHDPEVGDCWLSMRIPSDVVDETALPLLDALEDGGWLDGLPAQDGVIVFDVVER
jgi:hypothetical protein